MMNLSRRLFFLVVLIILGTGVLPVWATAQATQPGVVRQIGAIKAISGGAVTLTPDVGPDISVAIQDGARMLRMAPGQQDLKTATPIQLQDLQIGDRILVRGKMSDDNKTLLAAAVIVMKQSDIAAKNQRELQDWQHRGAGGLVKSVDPAAGTVTISTMTASGPKVVAIKSSKNTIVRRYAPDSVRFDEATLSKLGEIKPGDQLRARGDKNADGTEIAADEIVSGTFRNIAGTVSSVDAGNHTITVMDLSTKKPAIIRITGESQMHKLPQMLAMGLAMRLKGAASEGQKGQAAQPGPPQQGSRPPMGSPGSTEQGRPRGGDLQQMLTRLPAMPFMDLQKGDAVMIVSTPGSATSNMTAITLLSGVEPILTASPNGSGAASLLSPWSLASAPEGGGGPQQ